MLNGKVDTSCMGQEFETLNKLSLQDIDIVTVDNMISIEQMSIQIKKKIIALKGGDRNQVLMSASLSGSIKCIFCSLLKLVEMGDLEGIDVIIDILMLESGCHEIVESN